MKIQLLGALLVLMAIVTTVRADEPGLRIIVEGEDFDVETGWGNVPYRENYFASTFAITFLSRMGLLGAPANLEQGQQAVAVRSIQVPRDGTFHAMARFEQPLDCSVAFTLEIEQSGKVVYREAFGQLEDPKIWPLMGGDPERRRTPMHAFWWGGTDNIVWQEKGRVQLKKGAATLRLIAGPQPEGVRHARRHVDVICLTDDQVGMEAQQKARYLEFDGWLVQTGDLYARFTNPSDGLGPCVVAVQPYFQGQHSPYYVHVRDWYSTLVLDGGRLVKPVNYTYAGPRSEQVDTSLLAPMRNHAEFEGELWTSRGLNVRAARNVLDGSDYLKPGQTSGWVPVGQVLDALHHSKWRPVAHYADPDVDGSDLMIEFAVPNGNGKLKTIKRLRDTKPNVAAGSRKLSTLEVPGNVRDKHSGLRTQLETLTWLREEIAEFPKVGPRAKRLPIYGIMEFSGVMGRSDAMGEQATRLALELGSNAITSRLTAWADELGIEDRRIERAGGHWPVSQAVANAKKRVEQGTDSNISFVSYGDEIHIPPLKPQPDKLDEFNKGFTDYLSERGYPTDGVHYTTDTDDRWYYYSRLYSVDAGIERYAKTTRELEEILHPGVLTGANYSPHANYMVSEIQYVRPFKHRGMTMPWSEDYVWQIPEFSVQVTGYLTSAFRAGAKYDNLPIMMYIMPHSPGNTPRSFRLSFYTAIAHGARMLHYFCATPLAVGGTENYVASDDLGMWQAIRQASHEVGVFEDYVVDGQVRQARVGLLLSSVDDILAGASNSRGGIHNQERKALYYALRHAQTPVDFLTEDDVIDGLAKEYDTIYVTQEHLHSNGVAALTKWVEAGGTLVAMCGGGFINEFQEASPAAAALFGVKSQSLTKDPDVTMVLAKQDLPHLKPRDTAQWGTPRGEIQAPVLVWQHMLEAAEDAQVLGRFSGGEPAVIRKRHGQGQAVLFGFFPGMAYLKSGLPPRPVDRGSTDDAYAHYIPTTMDANLRKAFVNDFLPESFVRPVVASETLVETTIIDTPADGQTPARLAVPLINYTGQPLETLQIQIANLPDVSAVRSVQHESIEWQVEGDHLVLTLPLEIADMLLIDR